MANPEIAEEAASSASCLCPVCAEPRTTGAQRCGKCASFYSWTSHCRCCGTPVPEKASVCHECGKNPHAESSSRWSRFQTSGQGVLSLLVALFSVSGTIIALLSSLTLFHKSSTDVSFYQFPPDTLEPGQRGVTFEVVAYNSGNSPAFLSGARLVSSFDGAEWSTPLDFTPLRIERLDLQTVKLTLTGGLDLRKFNIKSQKDARYQMLLKAPHRIEIGIKEFGEERAWREVKEVPVSDLTKWLSDVTIEPFSTAQGSQEE